MSTAARLEGVLDAGPAPSVPSRPSRASASLRSARTSELIGSIPDGMQLLSLSSAVRFVITGGVLLPVVVIDAVIKTQRDKAGTGR